MAVTLTTEGLVRPPRSFFTLGAGLAIASPAFLHACLRLGGLLDAASVSRAQARTLAALYSVDVATALQQCPAALVICLHTVLVIMPGAVIAMGACSESAGREVASLAPADQFAKVAKEALLLVRFVFLASLVGFGVATIGSLAVRAMDAGAIVSWTLRLWPASAVALFPSVGLMVLIGTVSERKVHRAVLGSAALCTLWLARIAAHVFFPSSVLGWFFPANHEPRLLVPGSNVVWGAGSMLLWAAACVALAWVVAVRRRRAA